MNRRIKLLWAVILLVSVVLLSVSLISCDRQEDMYINFYLDNELYCSVSISDGEFVIPAPPKKQGYTFEGWYLDSQFNQAFNLTYANDVKLTAGSNLYAKFLLGEVDDCTIILQPNNGDKAIIFNLTTINFKFPTIIKQGYSFDGWYSDKALTTPWYSFDTLNDGNILYAKWQYVLPTVLVNYQSNGGSAVLSEYVDVGSKIAQPICERDSFNLLGWYIDIECNTKWEFDVDTVKVGMTLYAKWAEKHTVIVYGRSNIVLDKYTIKHGETINILPELTEDGNFIFLGWYEDVTGTVEFDASKPITKDIKIWSKWREKKEQIPVKYIVNGQTVATINYDKNTKIETPYFAEAKKNYSFFGWYTDAQMTKLWDFKYQAVSNSICLYGQYLEYNDNLNMSIMADDTYMVTGYSGDSIGEDIVLPESYKGKAVTAIGGQAFAGSAAKKIFISRSIKTIGDRAFDSAKFNTIYIPSSVEYIADSSFSNLNNLVIINLDTRNANYTVYEDAIFTSDYRQLISYAAACQRQMVILPKETLYISEYAFAQADNLKRVYLNDVLHTIGDGAFFGCDKLETLVFSNQINTIGARAFKDCKALTTLTLPLVVRAIDKEAFAECVNLVNLTMPQSCDDIGERAFKGLINLSSLELTCAFGSVERNAFDDCSGVIYLDSPSLPNNWAYDWTNSGNVKYADGFLSEDGLWQYTLKGESATLTAYYGDDITVTVPYRVDGNIVIAMGAIFFRNNTVYRVVVEAEISEIAANTFSGATKLGSIILPNTIEYIGEYAFYKCYSLASMAMSANIREIGEGAFADCSSLQRVYLSATLTNISKRAFANCSMLANIKLNDSLKFIGEGAFYNCTSLISVTWNSKLLAIGDSAFYNCSRLKSIVLPDSLRNVGDNAFSDCSMLSSVIISQNIESVGEGAFKNCISLTKVVFAPNSRLLIISNNAFAGCSALTAVELPKALTVVGDGAFMGANSLRSVTFGDLIYKIGTNAFKDCNLESIDLSRSLLYIGDGAFMNCFTMQYAVVGANIVKLSPTAFMGVTDMTIFIDGLLINYWGSDWINGNTLALDGQWAYIGGIPKRLST